MRDVVLELEDAYFLGYAAAQSALPQDSNPYAALLEQNGGVADGMCLLMARSWWRGWDDATDLRRRLQAREDGHAGRAIQNGRSAAAIARREAAR